jgi:hypothetical protein
LIETLVVTLIILLPLLVFASSVLKSLVSARLKELKWERFCRENDVKEIICVLSPGYLVFINSKGEVVKGIDPYDGLSRGLWDLLGLMKLWDSKLGVKVRYFERIQDLDDELVQAISAYNPEVRC